MRFWQTDGQIVREKRRRIERDQFILLFSTFISIRRSRETEKKTNIDFRTLFVESDAKRTCRTFARFARLRRHVVHIVRAQDTQGRFCGTGRRTDRTSYTHDEEEGEKLHFFFFVSIQDKRVLNWTVDFGHLEEVTVSDRPVVVVALLRWRRRNAKNDSDRKSERLRRRVLYSTGNYKNNFRIYVANHVC